MSICCEHDRELSGFVKRGEFRNLNRRNDFAPCT